MSRVLLSGGSGFLGSAVARRLLERGHAVALLSRQAEAPRLAALRGRYRPLRGGLEDPAAWRAELRDFRPDAVIHAAWNGLHGAERQDPAQQANVDQALGLQAEAAQAGAAYFLGVGSQAEFGPLHGPADESVPLRPDSEYGRAKVRAWEGLRREGGRLGQRTAWARVFSLYGPGDDPRWVLPATALQLLAGKKPSLGACEQPWDFLYGDDAAAAIVALLESGAGGDYNLGSGSAPSLRSTLEQLRDLVDPALPLGFGERPTPPGQSSHLQAVTARLRAATGWTPSTSLPDGLRQLLRSLDPGAASGPR